MAVSKRSSGGWVKALTELKSDCNYNRPSGENWKTIKELKELMGCGLNQIYDYVNKGMEEKKIERFSGSDINQAGQRVRRVWYRLK